MITYAKMLIVCMFALLYKEAPAIEHSQKARHIQHREDVQALGNIFTEVGSEGALVSPDIDPLLLASMSWEESRYRQHGPDGDPTFRGGHVICDKPGPCYAKPTPRVRVGQSIGPMQVSRGAPKWVDLWLKTDPEWGKPWKGLTVEKLREPATNVAFAYTLLKRYKHYCGGSPGIWIDSYGRGKCTPKRQIGGKAKLRCSRVDAFMKKMSELPEFEVPEKFSCMNWTPPEKKTEDPVEIASR